MSDLTERLRTALGSDRVLCGADIPPDYAHDEALGAAAAVPEAVVLPQDTGDVVRVVQIAAELGVALTARGNGSGLSGAAVPRRGGILVSFERMNVILEVDVDNHVAVVQPGVTLAELDAATERHRLVYPVFPGELHGTLGGNVATNAGGMRAVKYGVTRHHVLGVEAVLGTGEVIRSGGRFVKTSSGYDLTQLIVGSEGSLALVTKVTVKLQPRLAHVATVLAPFTTLDDVTAAIPRVVQSGLSPLLLEYIDLMSMAGIVANAGLDLGIPREVQDTALAYLVVSVESRRRDRLDEDVEELAELLGDLGAIDVYVLDGRAGEQLISAREKAFFAAKAAGADDIVDVVVPRAALPAYLSAVAEVAQRGDALVIGCGHAGDGNVHLSVFQPDEKKRYDVLHGIFRAGLDVGGAISGEHGIGTEKLPHVLALEDPAKLALMRRIKTAFDPTGILNPGLLYDTAPDGTGTADQERTS